jgi:hypothetical protein
MIHQATVTYDDGTESRFYSEDGRFFYENQLPDPHGRTTPLRYEREWLKQAARCMKQIKAIEFTERSAERLEA